MKFRQTEPVAVAAAKKSFSAAMAYRIEQDSRLPSAKREPRERRRPDPLGTIFEREVVPMLEADPGLRPIAIFEEIIRRHPELGHGIRRTMERRIPRLACLARGRTRGDLRQTHEPGRMGLSDFTNMDALAITISGVPLDHASITSALSTRASNTPTSCSVAKVLWLWQRASRTLCGHLAGPRSNTVATASLQCFAILPGLGVRI